MRTFLAEDVEINASSVQEKTIDRNKVELSLFNLFVAHTAPQTM